MQTVGELIRWKGHGVRSVQKDATVGEAAKAFAEHGISSLLVYDGDRLSGIFTKNDLVRRLVAGQSCSCERDVAECMTTEVYTTTPDADLEDVFAEMLARGFRHVPVLEGGRPVGMITPIDILMHQNNTIRDDHEQLMVYLYSTY